MFNANKSDTVISYCDLKSTVSPSDVAISLSVSNSGITPSNNKSILPEFFFY